MTRRVSKLSKPKLSAHQPTKELRQPPVLKFHAELLIPMKALGDGRLALYRRSNGTYFVRATGLGARPRINISLDVAAKIYEVESRWALDHLIEAKLKVPTRAVGEDGAIYDTRIDKRFFREAWYYEGVSGHETKDGRLYLRFVDPHETRIMILKDTGKMERALGIKKIKGPGNEKTMEYMAECVERWCGSDRTFTTLFDKQSDVYDPFLEYDLIVIDNKVDFDTMLSSSKMKARPAVK